MVSIFCRLVSLLVSLLRRQIRLGVCFGVALYMFGVAFGVAVCYETISNYKIYFKQRSESPPRMK